MTNQFTPIQPRDARRDLRIVTPGSTAYIDKIKYVREQLGLYLRETKDLVDMAPALSADEIVNRYTKVRTGGVYVQDSKIETIGYFLISGSFPELAGYHKTLSVWLKTFADQHRDEIRIIELVDRQEVMEQIGLMAHMKAT